MPLDFQRIQNVFQVIVELAPTERAAVLKRECGDDAELRRQIEALLKAHDDSGELPELDSPSTGPYVSPAASGQVFAGRYKLRERLGEGGMGTVFVADQTEPVKRRVALKIIKHGVNSAWLMARFDQERQALALMDHPNIAKVFDAGVDGGGRPYFAMELIKGLPLTKYCDEAKIPPRKRLELFLPICHAVQHAHQKGIIHRDLKPSNILVGLYDGRPVPKVIDFGVAKATGPRLTEQSIYTEVGSLIGTLEYMSPEQAELNNLDIDTRSDVYALGVILYELLAGSVPFSRKELEKAGLAEMLRVIKESEPPKPSTRLSGSGTLPTIAAARQTEPKQLTALVRGELDWIVMKALEKDRSRRYETANGFAVDVQRYLAGEAVQAAPASKVYRLRKFVRRNRGPMIATSLVTIAVLSGIAGTTWGMVRADQQRQRAEAKETEANAVVKFFQEQVFAAGRPKGRGGLGKDVTLKQAIDASLTKLSTSFKDQPLVEARLRRALGLTFKDLGEVAKTVEQFEQARALYLRHLGPDHHDTLACTNGLGLSCLDLGRNRESLHLFEEVLAVQQRILPPDHADTIMSLLNIGLWFGKMEQQEEALKRFQEVLAACNRALPADHLLALNCKANIATCDAQLGQHEEALKLRAEVLAVWKRVDPPDEIEIAGGKYELAMSHAMLGHHNEALKLLQESLATFERVFPPGHPSTLGVIEPLSEAYSDLGQHEEARNLLEKTLADLKRIDPTPDQPATLRIKFNLANRYEKLGQHHKALDLREETVAAHKRILPRDHRTVLMGMVNLANSYMALNRPADALQQLKEALGQPKLAALGPQGVNKTVSMALACCQKLGDVKEWRALATLLEMQAPSADNLYNVACCWSCAASLQAKAKDPDSAKLAKEDADKAIAWLTKVLAAGYKDIANMKKDTDLDCLRDREDFKKLFADLEAKKP